MKAFLSKLQASVEQLQMVPSVHPWMPPSIVIVFEEATNEFGSWSGFFLVRKPDVFTEYFLIFTAHFLLNWNACRSSKSIISIEFITNFIFWALKLYFSIFSGPEKTEHDDDLIFEEFARMRVRGEHQGDSQA